MENPLSFRGPYKYLFLDGVNFDISIDRSIEKVPVFVAIGLQKQDTNGFKASRQVIRNLLPCREFFKDLKKRGPDGIKMVLGVMDGLPGFEKVFMEEFPKAKVRRCQDHVVHNVLTKMPNRSASICVKSLQWQR